MVKRKKQPMFCFKCKNCGFGLSINSGVPSKCDICNNYFTFIRISHEEFHILETIEIR